MVYTKEMIQERLAKKEKIRKVLQKMYVPVIILMLLGCSSILYQKFIEKETYVELLGIKSFSVMTGSMEPALHIGDVVFVNKVSPDKIHEGDIITYSLGSNGQTVTHRVIKKVEKDGQQYYQTKGDNNNTYDTELVAYKDIVGKVNVKIHYLGAILNLLRTTSGIALFLFIILLSWSHSLKKNDRMLAREEARRKFNVYKYTNDGEDVNGTI